MKMNYLQIIYSRQVMVTQVILYPGLTGADKRARWQQVWQTWKGSLTNAASDTKLRGVAQWFGSNQSAVRSIWPNPQARQFGANLEGWKTYRAATALAEDDLPTVVNAGGNGITWSGNRWSVTGQPTYGKTPVPAGDWGASSVMIKDWVEWGPVLTDDPVVGGVREIGGGLIPGPGTHSIDMPTLGQGAGERIDSKARARMMRSRIMGGLMGDSARTVGGTAYDITNLDKMVGGVMTGAGYGTRGIEAPNQIKDLFFVGGGRIENSAQVDAAFKLLSSWRSRSTSAYQMPDQEPTPRKFTEDFLENSYKGGWTIADIRSKLGPYPAGYKINPDLVTKPIGGSLGEDLILI